MKRRNFIRNLGLGTSGLFMAQSARSSGKKLEKFRYPQPKELDEVADENGHLALRIAFTYHGKAKYGTIKGAIRTNNASIDRIKGYFLEPEDIISPESGGFDLMVPSYATDVLVVWLNDYDSQAVVELNIDDRLVSIPLNDLLEKRQHNEAVGDVEIAAHFLLYFEVGSLNPKDVGIKDPGTEFDFVALADPQGGNPFISKEPKTRMRIHNAFIEESVKLVNKLLIKPAFSIVIGDITDGNGLEEDFIQMNQYLKQINTPVLYSIGNHETDYKLEFGPGYNMSGFDNYFAAQKEMNGMDKLLYSFDLGEWHFVVWPDPLREGFWETHPHYFDWLERDLEKNKNRPVMFFQHVPMHPIGINPLINYAESVDVKQQLLQILSRWKNVKYVLSGHVHIPVKASFKTAVEINGIKFLNLPAAGYRPRAFGEEDFYGGPAQGAAIIQVRGKKADIYFKTVTEEEYKYPDLLPVFDQELYSMWFTHRYAIPASKQLKNGSFENGLQGWGRRYCYQEDQNPSNKIEIRRVQRNNSSSALYLFSKKRGHNTPGQDRLPQAINILYQAVSVNPDRDPYLGFSYCIDESLSDLNNLSGAFVWLEGYKGSLKYFNLVYSMGKVWANIGGKEALTKPIFPYQLDLTAQPGKWHSCVLNPRDDFKKLSDSADSAPIDRMIINLGTWNINQGDDNPVGIYFDDLVLDYDRNVSSNREGKNIELKPVSERWWRGKEIPNANLAGEHRYNLATPVKFTSL